MNRLCPVMTFVIGMCVGVGNSLAGGVFNNTGANRCQDVTVVPLAVGPLGTPNTVTIMGDNTPATGPDCTSMVSTAPVWWEAFELTECATVTIDLCETTPVQEPSYDYIWAECPTSVAQCTNFELRPADVDSRGAPFCADNNAWATYEFLSPGVYSVPVLSDTSVLINGRGPYVMHLHAEACPGACCTPSAETCVDGVAPTACTGVDQVFEPTKSCCEAECIPPGEEYASKGVELLSRVSIGSLSGVSTEVNDCWGYVSPSGQEYAVLGLNETTAFVRITNPFNPVVVADIPDATSHWSDVKVYGEYAYNCTENGGGIQIFDLTQIDQGIVQLVGALTDSGLQTSHTITVNPDSGYLYLNRPNIASAGLVAVSLADPADPVIVGAWMEQILHDSQVVSYTIGPYAGREIAFCYCGGAGLFIVDVTDKGNMFTMSSLTYPDMAFCHQGWLTDDRRHLLINDEQDEIFNGFPARTYIANVEDLENPFFVEFYSNGKCTVDHDLIIDGPLVYKVNDSNGLRVDDLGSLAARKSSASMGTPIEVAFFDTHPEGNIVDYVGAWGVFSGYPSGVVIVSDRERGLFVLNYDCNRNRIDDTDDITLNTSQDVNGNGLPDECELATLSPPTTGDDTCQITTGPSSGAPCTTNADCTVPGEVCGSKSRYLSVTPTNAVTAGGTTSIRVEIVSAKECAGGTNVGRGCEVNAQCPGSTCVNSPKIGDVWWAGAEGSIPNSPQAPLRGSLVQCSATPANAQVWTNGVLHLYGPPIVPFATYNVRMCDVTGGNCSDPLLVATGEWGDVVRPFGGVSQPAFGDINEVVFKFRNLGLSQPMPRVDLVGVGNPGQPNTPNQSANFGDIGACVEGFRSIGYAHTVTGCP